MNLKVYHYININIMITINEENIPGLFIDSSDKIREIIITFGTACYLKLLNGLNNEQILQKFSTVSNDNIFNIYEEEIRSLQNTNTSLKKKIDDNFTMYKNDLDKELLEKKIMYENRENELKKQIIILQKDTDKIVEEKLSQQCVKHNEEIINMKNTIEIMNSKNAIEIKYKDEQINSLKTENNHKQETIDTFIGKRKFKNNTEQGNYGENIIDEVVNKGLSCDKKAVPVDTSETGGSGDRIIKFNNGKVLMVEVKLKGVITREDREQFEKHYKKDFEENKCDGALFISLMTEQIPNIGNEPIVHIKDNVAYYGLDESLTLDEKKIRIDRCIYEVYTIINKDQDKKEKNEEENCNIYNILLENLNIQKKETEENLKTHRVNQKKDEKKLLEVNKTLNNTYKDIQYRCITGIDQKLIDDNIYISELITRINTWKKENNISYTKQTFKNIILEKMKVTELDERFIKKKIKFNDIN